MQHTLIYMQAKIECSYMKLSGLSNMYTADYAKSRVLYVFSDDWGKKAVTFVKTGKL